VSRIGKNRNAYRFWLESLKLRDRLEDLGLDRVILVLFKLVLQNWDGEAWTGVILLRREKIVGLL
jgi:hypothetical protein